MQTCTELFRFLLVPKRALQIGSYLVNVTGCQVCGGAWTPGMPRDGVSNPPPKMPPSSFPLLAAYPVVAIHKPSILLAGLTFPPVLDLLHATALLKKHPLPLTVPHSAPVPP